MSVTYRPLPKHKPHDVIKSEEWNIIADDLEWLKQNIGGGAAVAMPSLYICCIYFDEWLRGYITIWPWLYPASVGGWSGDFYYFESWDNDAINRYGVICNRSYTMRKMKAIITYFEESPDANIDIGVAVNGDPTDLKVTIPPTISEGDIFEDNVHEVSVSEGDRVTMYADALNVSAGMFQAYIQMEYE